MFDENKEKNTIVSNINTEFVFFFLFRRPFRKNDFGKLKI
jgi:hypothetical protein